MRAAGGLLGNVRGSSLPLCNLFDRCRTMSTEGLARLREHIRNDKPKQLRKDFAMSKPLTWGWLLPYLLGLEDMAWGRWDYWAKTNVAGKLLPEPLPRIEWAAEHGEGSPARRMLERALNSVTKYGEWRGWSGSQHLDYFLDWLLFGFGDQSQKQLPNEGSDCTGASERLYQLFNLEPLLAYPHDYLGDIMAENAYGKHCGFFPTPMEIASVMCEMQMANEDIRGKSVMDPCVGTGRMLLCASNYSMRLYGNDINPLIIKGCKVNGYLYAPWLVRSVPCLEKQEAAPVCLDSVLPTITTKTEQGQIEWELV